MTTTGKELIKQVLEKWKFPVVAETETGLLFRYQMSYIQVNETGDDDAHAIILLLEGAFTLDDENGIVAVLKTCNELTGDLLHVKLYVRENKLMISSEFFYGSPEDMEYLLNMGLRTIILAKKRFLQRYPEIEEEMKFLAELDDQILEDTL